MLLNASIGIIVSGGLYQGAKIYRERLSIKSKQKKKNISSLSIEAGHLEKTEEKLLPVANSSAHDKIEISQSAGDKHNVSSNEKKINHYFAVSSLALGLTTVAAFGLGPLNWASAALVLYVSKPGFFQPAYESLFKQKKIGISVADSILVIGALLTGHYFAAAVSNCFFYASRKLLAKTEDHALKSIFDSYGEQPHSVWILHDDVEVKIPFEELDKGDIVVVHPGEIIPVDGTISSGLAGIDEHALTGESTPAEKGVGDQVFASTLVLEGQIGIEVEKAGAETVAMQIGEVLKHTADYRLSIQSRGEVLANKEVIPRLCIGLLSIPILGPGMALTAMNCNFFWNMRVLAPIGMLTSLNHASELGILIKDGRSLEILNKIDTVVFDKTGTLTQTQPHIGQIYSAPDILENDLLTYAAAAEVRHTHPIALAILEEAEARQLMVPTISKSKYEIGYGIKVQLSALPSPHLETDPTDEEQLLIRVGSAQFMEMENIFISPYFKQVQSNAHDLGYSLVYVAINDNLGGVIELHQTLRPEIQETIQLLRQRGMGMVILSGDHEEPTKKLATDLQIDDYFAEVLPVDKANVVERLQEQGRSVCFIGDGINDSIALKRAHVGISMSGATTIATDTAQIVMMDGSLKQLVPLFELANNFDRDLSKCLVASVTPGIITLSGAFLWHMSLAASMVVNQVGFFVGTANLMWPLLARQFKKSQTLGEQSQSRL